MPTFCRNCGDTLAPDMMFCPKCGTATSSYYSHSGSSQSDPTALSSQTKSPQQEVLPDHGSPLYGLPPWNPYEQFDPYGIIPPPPPPPRQARSSLLVGVMSGIVVSILILGVVGTVVWLLPKGRNTPGNSTSSSLAPTSTAALSQGSSQSCGGAFSDKFNGSLDSRWRWVDPGGNAAHEVTSQSHLRISAPTNNDLHPTTNYNAPRLLEPIGGNFTVETSVEFSPSAPYQGAGLLIWQDESNFLRLERGYIFYQGIFYQGILFVKVEKGTLTDISPLPSHLTTATRVEFRIQRNGDHLAAWWREFGKEWQFDGETTLHFDNPMIGLILAAQYSQGPPQTTAYYDYFLVTCT